MAATRVVLNPVTRIEGHLRAEAIPGGGTPRDPISTGNLRRGIESILEGRDPREAWAFCERICGACTTVHAVASVRAVEDALGIRVPENAEIIRNMMFLAQFLQDHVVQFYHRHALDWVDLVSSLKADPAAAAALEKTVSPSWSNSSPACFAGVQAKVRRFVDSGQWGIFGNAYGGHPAYKLPPEGNLLVVAHYFEALRWQKEIVKIHAVFGGRNPHPNYRVGGMAAVLTPTGDERSEAVKESVRAPAGQTKPSAPPVGQALSPANRFFHSFSVNTARLDSIGDQIRDAIRLVEGMYLPDLHLLASFYPEWSFIGGGMGNFMAYGDVPQNGIGDPSRFRFPQGAILGGSLGGVLPLDLTDLARIHEHAAHSWYEYPAGKTGLHPAEDLTSPEFTAPAPPFNYLHESGKYSWVKAPRWRGNTMEVGPLARVLVGYASGRADFRDVVNEALERLGWAEANLISTMGRTLARGLETRLCAAWLKSEYEALLANVRRGVLTTADSSKWEPSTWPTASSGSGFAETPRGACAHWIWIRSGRIAQYQIVAPSAGNASPEDCHAIESAPAAALLGTDLADPSRPLEILRTVHSFDPCLSCADPVVSPADRRLADGMVC